MLLFPPVKCTQYHVLQLISPRKRFSSPLSSSWTHTHTDPEAPTHAHALYTRVHCVPTCFIYLCAEQTPRWVSLVSSVMMMKGTCCSQQKAFSTPCNRHPACIIHKSSGNSVTSATRNFSDVGRRETVGRGGGDPRPHHDFPVTVFTLYNLPVLLSLPSEITLFQAVWNVFPVRCFET